MEKLTLLITKVAWDITLYVKDLPVPILFILISWFLRLSPSFGCSYPRMKVTMENHIQTLVTSITERIIFEHAKLI